MNIRPIDKTYPYKEKVMKGDLIKCFNWVTLASKLENRASIVDIEITYFHHREQTNEDIVKITKILNTKEEVNFTYGTTHNKYTPSHLSFLEDIKVKS